MVDKNCRVVNGRKWGPIYAINDPDLGTYLCLWRTLPWGLEDIHVGMCIGGVGKKCLRINFYPFMWEFYGWMPQGFFLGPIQIDQGVKGPNANG